jgi:hypothetical protein
MKDLQKIAQMVGQTYLYKKENYTIRGFIPEEQKVRLLTDSTDIVLLEDGLHHSLTLFLEVEQEDHALQVRQTQVHTQASSTLTELNTIMMDTIRKVQTDKEYVQQAGAINKSVTNITNLLKAQLEMMKLSQTP